MKLKREFIKSIKRISTKLLPKRIVEWQHKKNPWRKVDGDNSLRIEYPLDENSIVFDLGGYRGDWTNSIFTKYGSNLFVFEPVELYANEIRKRFIDNNKIKVYSFGISSKEETLEISVNGVASSVFKPNSNQTVPCQLKEAINVLDSLGITSIDLMKINIEGGEYDLLEHLIATKKTSSIKNIQVQFHDFVDNSEKRMINIQNKLKNTHELTYQYKYIWENWKIKS